MTIVLPCCRATGISFTGTPADYNIIYRHRKNDEPPAGRTLMNSLKWRSYDGMLHLKGLTRSLQEERY